MAVRRPPRFAGMYGRYRGMGAPPLPMLPAPPPPPRPPAVRGGSVVVAPQNRGLVGPGFTPYRGPGAPSPPTFQPPPGGSLTDDQILAQARARAQAIYDPLIQQIVDSINRRGQQGAADLAALTGEYAKAAGQYAQAIPGIYGQAESQTAAAVQSLSDRLQGEGASTGKDLAATLAQAGVSGPGDVNLAQMGAGAGNAAYGTGIAELDRLIANGAAAQTFAAGEPSRAYAGGQQQLGQFQRYLAGLLATQQGQLTAQIPGTAEQIAESLYARQDQQGQEAERVREFNATQAADAAARTQQANQFAATQAENRRRYAQGQTRQRMVDRQTLLDRFEQRTGYQGVLTSTGVTYKRGPGGVRVPTQATKDRAYNTQQTALAQKRQTAATLTGEKGYIYQVDSKGRVRPVDVKPNVPGLQPSYTQQGQANRQNIINAKVARLQSLGLVTDPKTGQQVYTPQARRQIKRLTGLDPGVGPSSGTHVYKVVGSDASGRKIVDLATGKTVAAVTTPIAKTNAPKIVKGADGRYWRVSADGTHATPVKGPPATPTKPASGHYQIVGSDKAGRYLINKDTGERIRVITKPVSGSAQQPRLVHGADGRWYRVSPDGKSAVPVRGTPKASKKKAVAGGSGYGG